MIRFILISALLVIGGWYPAFAESNKDLNKSLDNQSMNHAYWVWSPVSSLLSESQSAELDSVNKQQSVLILEKNGTAYIEIPRDHWLRVTPEENTNIIGQKAIRKPEDLIWRSKGNGLFLPSTAIKEKPQPNVTKASSAWLVQGQTRFKTLIRINNPIDGPFTLKLSLGENITSKQNKTLNFKQLENVNGDHENWYYLSSQSKHLKLNKYEDNEAISINLEGPGNWKLESRLLYDNQDWQRFIDIPLSLNGKYWHNWRMHPSIDHGNVLHQSQCNALTSYPERYYFSLPKGQHRIEFTAPQAMYVRLLKQDNTPYLSHRNKSQNPIHSTNIRDFDLSNTPFDRTYSNQYEFDKAILNAFYSGSITQQDINSQLSSDKMKHKASYPWVHDSTAFRDIIQRYQFWKPLNIENNESIQNKAWLVPVKPINPRKGKSRYIRRSYDSEIELENLITLKASSQAELHVPSQKNVYSVRLQLPIYSKPYDIKILDRNGKQKHWLWRPKHFFLDDFEIQSGANLTELYSGDRQYTEQALATVSGEMTLSAQDFPIRLSHNAEHDISLSAFYKELRHFSLDQNSWQRAINTLGRKRILKLLTSESVGKASKHPLLENKVIQDLRAIKEWLFHNRQTWSGKLSSETFSSLLLKGETISSLTNRLTNKGEYKLLTDVLKGISVKDPSPKRRSQAMNWLYKYYTEKQDAFNLSAYHSWKFKYFPELHLPILTRWLVQQGQSKLALRLYSLFPSDQQDIAKYYTNAKHNWPHNGPNKSSLHLLWKSMWEQDWEQAMAHGEELNKKSQWQAFVKAMPDYSDQNKPVKWLNWLQNSPDSEIQVPISLTPKNQAGTALIYNTKRDRSFQVAKAQPNNPIEYQVIGPVTLQLGLRLQHANSDPMARVDDWVEIRNGDSKKWFPIFNSRASENLNIVPKEAGAAGSIKQLNIELGPGSHRLSINALNNALMVNAKVHSPALLSNLMDSIQNGDGATDYLKTNTRLQSRSENDPLPATELLDNISIHQLSSCDQNQLFNLFSFNAYSQKTDWKIPSQGNQWQVPHTLDENDISQDINISDAITNIYSLEQYLLSTLWKWKDINPNQRATIVAKVNHLVQGKLNTAEIRNLTNKLNQPYGWKKEDLILSSAGSKRINQYLESDYISERERLIFQGQAKPGERLYGHNQLGLMMDFRRPTKVQLNITQTQLPYQLKPKANLLITLNQKQFKSITLTKEQQKISLSIPSGKQRLRIRLQEPSSDHWIYVKATASVSGRKVNLMEPRQSKFHVATEDQPLNLHVKQASWLRIDQYSNGKVKQEYKLQKEPGQLSLKPKDGQAASMYRIFSLQEKPDTKPLLPFSINTANYSEKLPQSEAKLLSNVPVLHPSFSASEDENKTTINGFYYKHDIRYDEDDNARNQDTEKFNELGWHHRKKMECLSCYWRSDLFARSHTDGETDVIGAELWLQGALPYSNNWSWRLKQDALYTNNEAEAWRWAGRFNLIKTYRINESIQYKHNLELFAQHLSFDAEALPKDSDVYSTYKDQHKWGIKLEESITSRPWLDTFLRGHFRLVSNELDEPLDLDYVQAGLAWSQYWKPLEVSMDYRHRAYLVDQQRDSTVHQPTLGLNFRIWHSREQKDLIQYRARLNRDLNTEDYTFTFEISWNMTKGMGFNHFMPSESAFHSLKRDSFNPSLAQPLGQEALHGE